jgi:hypothetical protein
MEIKVNIPIEVNKQQYLKIIREFSGVVAHRTEKGKYYIKILLTNYVYSIKQELI